MSFRSVFIFLPVFLFVFEAKAQEGVGLEELMEDNPEIRALYKEDPSLWSSGPALTAYFTLGIGLITKLYLNWMKETRMIEEESLHRPIQFKKLKSQMKKQYPHATAEEIERLTMNNMEHGKTSGPHCHSCDHHHHDHGPSTTAESVEADLLKWIRVVDELNSIGSSNFPQKINESEFSYLKRTSGITSSIEDLLDFQETRPPPSGPSIESIMNIFSKKIDRHLEILKADFESLDKLQHDFDQVPLWKLNKRKKDFFAKYDQPIKHFFMGFLRLVIRSGKTLAWDYTAKPAYEIFQTPRRKLLPLLVRGRISTGENGPLNSLVISSMGAGLFIAYEMILHGILHIHTFCNHSLNLSLAMATSGFIFDVLKQPFKVYGLLPKHFTLSRRLQLSFSVAFAKWQEGRLRAGIRWIHPKTGKILEYSRKSFWNHYGHQMAHLDHFTKMLLNSSLWGPASAQFLDQTWKSQSKKKVASSWPENSQTLEPEIKILFSPSFESGDKHQLVIDILSGFRISSESLYHTLGQMAFLTRFDPESLKKAQTALGKLRGNILRVEEILLLIAKLPSSKTENIFGGPESLIEVLNDIQTQLHSLGKEVIDIHKKSFEFPRISKAQMPVPIQGGWIDPSERPPELMAIIRNLEHLEQKTSLQTKKLKTLRRQGEIPQNNCKSLLTSL